jgi:hypothetical protein
VNRQALFWILGSGLAMSALALVGGILAYVLYSLI